MTKKGANTGFILLGTGVALAVAMSITGVVVFNKRKRQSEYDFLIKVINANLDENTLSKLKGSSFDKNYYKQNPKCVSIDNLEAQRQAKKIYDAKGTILDDTLAVETVFKNSKSKCDVSRFSDAFYGMYQKDMLLYLNSFLDNSEMEKYVYSYTNKLT